MESNQGTQIITCDIASACLIFYLHSQRIILQSYPWHKFILINSFEQKPIKISKICWEAGQS